MGAGAGGCGRDPYQALQAVTVNAVWQVREKQTKGTLEVGKVADLVILVRNPLQGDPGTIHPITLLKTIKEGRTIFRRVAGPPGAAPQPSDKRRHEAARP